MKVFKKIISILFTIVLVAWIGLIIFDFIRCGHKDDNGVIQKPLIVIKETKYNYDDGFTTEYMSLGYKYIEYNRNSLRAYEFGPFWLKIRTQ